MIRSIRGAVLGAALASLASFVLGCGDKNAPPPATPAAEATAKPEPAKAAEAPKPALNVAEDILAACKITLENPQKAPKFDLDSSDVQPEERDVLSKLATCLTTGPLKGRSVKLTGRADPRGETQYNMALGATRAKAVSNYLTQLGVEQKRLKETSRGELDASGTDESSWKNDRRVDVTLAE